MAKSTMRGSPPAVATGPAGSPPQSLPGIIARRKPEYQIALKERRRLRAEKRAAKAAKRAAEASK